MNIDFFSYTYIYIHIHRSITHTGKIVCRILHGES